MVTEYLFDVVCITFNKWVSTRRGYRTPGIFVRTSYILDCAKQSFKLGVYSHSSIYPPNSDRQSTSNFKPNFETPVQNPVNIFYINIFPKYIFTFKQPIAIKNTLCTCQAHHLIATTFKFLSNI
jgi:hypothetical protein